ncbi:MAG: hypothetical protein DCF22_10675 [Leptolyngbya sp.]|nr:MAG: hypothetical protein DCF22_10675 [Leptolyngbya sp.]
MANREDVLQIRLRFILAIAATPVFFSSLIGLEPQKVTAQITPASPTFKLPSSLPSGTTIKVDGSSSMGLVNESFKERFQDKFPGATVNLAAIGTDEALKGLTQGTVNIAAIGRPLTQAEKRKGWSKPLLVEGRLQSLLDLKIRLERALPLTNLPRFFAVKLQTGHSLGGHRDPFAWSIALIPAIPVER